MCGGVKGGSRWAGSRLGGSTGGGKVIAEEDAGGAGGATSPDVSLFSFEKKV